MTNVDIIEDLVVTYLRTVPGIEDTLDYEPGSLPRGLPIATLLYLGSDPEQAETGATGTGEDVTHFWRVSLYVALQDYKVAQQSLKDLIPAMQSKLRAHPTGDGACDFLKIRDTGPSEPVFSPKDGYVRKSFELTAKLTEH